MTYGVMPFALRFRAGPTFLWMTPDLPGPTPREGKVLIFTYVPVFFDPLLKDPEGLFVDSFSGTDGNEFYLPAVLNPIDDSERTDSKTSQS
jgi:hypothetical protein